MTMPTLDEVLDGIEGVLGTATGLKQHQTYDQLTEGIPETPLLQVYPHSLEPDQLETYTKFRVEKLVVYADLYARLRSNLRDDMAKVVEMGQAMLVVIRTEDEAHSNFGVTGVHAWNWSMERVLFEYGDPSVKYAGLRFTFNVWIHP
jgi:hypothetical protein